MSSFNDIATNLDQRLTVLETYFNSLTTKGCPRATCGIVMPEMVIKRISVTHDYKKITILNNSIQFKSFSDSGGVGTVQACQFQTQKADGTWVTSGEVSITNTQGIVQDVLEFVSYSYSYSYGNTTDIIYLKTRWKTQEYGWSEWSQAQRFQIQYISGQCTEIY